MRREFKLSHYARIIGDTPRLTKAEELDAYLRGDTELLIRSQLPWVARIAVGIANRLRFRDVDSVISEGNQALLRSIKTFDATRGFRLTTYVYRPVSQQCWRYICWGHLSGPQPTNRIRELKGLGPTKFLGDQTPLVPTDGDVERLVRLAECADLIEIAMEGCSERDRDIVYRCVVMDETLKSVGESYGISKERVRQIKNGSLLRARTVLCKRLKMDESQLCELI